MTVLLAALVAWVAFVLGFLAGAWWAGARFVDSPDEQ